MKSSSANDIWKNLQAIYTEMSAEVKNDNVEALKNYLAWASRVLPYLAQLKAEAGYFLDQKTEEETLAAIKEHPGMTPTILKNVLRGKLKSATRVYEFASSLHSDLTKQADNYRTLISFEKAHLNNLEGHGRP